MPGQYRDFILDTTKVKFSDVKFENGAWLNAPMPDSGDGATAMFPLKIGASATLPNVGEWTDGSGHTHSINAIISLHSWNGAASADCGPGWTANRPQAVTCSGSTPVAGTPTCRRK